MLATYGMRTLLVSKYGWVSNTPRAHITNQRMLEVLRDLGVEQQALADGTPQELMGDTVLCTSLAGEEIGRIRTWGTSPYSLSEYAAASPCGMIDLPQTYLEPILVTNAAARGAKVRFDTEFLSLDQDEDGVTARLLDRVRGDEFTVRARYLIGADGGRSLVADQLGLPIAGQTGKAGSMNIVFQADLSRYVAHRPSILYWVMRWTRAPPSRSCTTWSATPQSRSRSPRRRCGRSTTATPRSIRRAGCSARVAVHRHPPSNGLGSNTSVQDSYNLAWKLAMVIRGQAGPGLLTSYTAKRAPVGRQIVDRANLSRDQFGPIFEALGIAGGSDEEGIVAGLAACRADGYVGWRRAGAPPDERAAAGLLTDALARVLSR